MVDDTALVAGLQAGDPAALAAAYDRYAGLVYGLARRALGPQTAEEVVQETFVRVWRNAHGFDHHRGSLQRWLLAIARNCIIDELRKRQGTAPLARPDEAELAFARLMDPAVGPEDHAWQRDVSRRIAEALLQLPEEQQHVIALAFFGGYSQSEIASLTGAPLGTVKKRIRLGIQKLRAALAGALTVESR